MFPRAEFLTKAGPGGVSFSRLRKAIKNELGGLRSHKYVTTMIDLYGLQGFPESARLNDEDVYSRVRRIETAMHQALRSAQFIPYIQLHEFEAIVFVDLNELPNRFPDGEADAAANLLRAEVGDTPPEEIDDGPTTAPSKRLARAVPSYEFHKAEAGPTIAAAIGLARIRARCPHLNSWVTRLEQLSSTLVR